MVKTLPSAVSPGIPCRSLDQIPTSSKYFFGTDPETIILTFARKLERVPVKLDRPRFKRRRGGTEAESYIYRGFADASRATPLSNTCSIRGNTAVSPPCATPFFHSRDSESLHLRLACIRIVRSVSRIRCESRALTDISDHRAHSATMLGPHVDRKIISCYANNN